MSFEAAFNDGLVAVKAGKGMIARLQFEQVTELAPEFAEGWLWLAWTSDTPDQAEKHLRKALKLNPKNELTRAYLDVVTALRDFQPGTDFSTFRAGSPPAAKQERAKQERAEQERSEQERAEQERAEQERAEQERAEQERAEQERAEQERAEQERAEQERAEQERAEQERAEQERAEQERAEQERAEQERAEQERAEQERAEQERAEQAPAEESDADDADQAERERAAAAFAFIANKASEVAKPDDEAEVDELAEEVQELQEDVNATLACTDTVGYEDVKAATESERSAAAPGDADHPSTEQSNGEKPTVLVVDDSPTVRKIVTMTLEADGYEVVSAEDGVAATKILVTFSPNLILLDINMPRMGGYKLCKLIKAHPDTSSIPVVMLSGKDGLFDKLRGKLVGCDDYISKPFESADLLKCVREHINLTIHQ